LTHCLEFLVRKEVLELQHFSKVDCELARLEMLCEFVIKLGNTANSQVLHEQVQHVAEAHQAVDVDYFTADDDSCLHQLSNEGPRSTLKMTWVQSHELQALNGVPNLSFKLEMEQLSSHKSAQKEYRLNIRP